MITINALKELSKLVREKTDGKIDIDDLYFFVKSGFSIGYGLTTTCSFLDVTDNGCYVVTAEFIQGEYLRDTLIIASFERKGYKSYSEFVDDVSEYSKIDRSTLLIFLTC